MSTNTLPLANTDCSEESDSQVFRDDNTEGLSGLASDDEADSLDEKSLTTDAGCEEENNCGVICDEENMELSKLFGDGRVSAPDESSVPDDNDDRSQVDITDTVGENIVREGSSSARVELRDEGGPSCDALGLESDPDQSLLLLRTDEANLSTVDSVMPDCVGACDDALEASVVDDGSMVAQEDARPGDDGVEKETLESSDALLVGVACTTLCDNAKDSDAKDVEAATLAGRPTSTVLVDRPKKVYVKGSASELSSMVIVVVGVKVDSVLKLILWPDRKLFVNAT